MDQAQPGDILLVVHDFVARSPDELALARGDRIELIERDDDFGDGWFLGKHLQNGQTGLFPEVYTTPAPRATLISGLNQRPTSQPRIEPVPASSTSSSIDAASPAMSNEASANVMPPKTPGTPSTQSDHTPSTSPLQISSSSPSSIMNRGSLTGAAVPRSLSMALSTALGDDQASPVMNETLSVIDEHITDMHTPRQSIHSIVASDRRAGNDSGSEYSSGHLDHRMSYINGRETDEEEQNLHTEEEVLAWTPARVAEYLEDVGVEKRHCDFFREQEISGEVLLGMDQSTIFLKEFELGPVGPRLRTWLKIKALQQEVKTARAVQTDVPDFSAPGDSPGDLSRTRSTSIGTVLPRIPSLMESPGSRAPSRQGLQRASSQLHSHSMSAKVEAPSPLANVTPSSPGLATASRPSAQSVRSLNHNRRHSSIDYSANSPVPSSLDGGPSGSPNISHKKLPSFDRNWTMGGFKAHEPLRPSSSLAHTRTLSSDGLRLDGSPREFGMTIMSPADLDRGYFSGNEVDTRKGRNVLRKKDSPAHSRNPSYTTESSRQSMARKRHSRMGSVDSTRDAISGISPAAKIYYGAHQKSHRTASSSDFVRPLASAQDMTPTVTKLDFRKTPSIGAVASSPKPAGSEATSGRASPSPGAHSHSFFSKKSRVAGLRAISDAITGTEKALASLANKDKDNKEKDNKDSAPSPIKESPIASPTRTGSSTPSATSKSFDYENDFTKRSTGSSSTATSTATRRKSGKKHTSAYTRGLQRKTPQEQMVNCDYSGWMKKRSSNLMTTWKPRLFILRGRRLSYYYSESDTEEKGLIDISSHRVLPANNERITGLHATLTGATSSPTSPHDALIGTAASTDADAEAAKAKANGAPPEAAGMFIFKLVPPRSGLSKAVNFTKPTVHYFAVDNIQQGRLWMAALMKATIDRDETQEVVSTYQQKTISLAKARAMRQLPPALRDTAEGDEGEECDEKGLAISGLEGEKADGNLAESEKSAKSVDQGSELTVPLPSSTSGSLKDDAEKKE